MRNALSLAILSGAAASCFSPVIERQCEKDADCGSGWVCIAQNCLPPSPPPDGGVGGGAAGGIGGGVGGGTAGGDAGGVGGGTAGGTSDGGGGAGGIGGGGGTGLCNTTNCADGCCSGNLCIPSGLQTTTNCGTKANACAACAVGSTCMNGACSGGMCNAATCPDGCCSGNGCVKVNFQSQLQCGDNGSACGACSAGTMCNDGKCDLPPCNVQTCPDGCCLANVCIPASGQSGNVCGRAGIQCEQCSPGSACKDGSCSAGGCGPQSCMGCCFNGSCLRGTDQFACGIAGNACGICPAGSTCPNGVCEGCGPMTCAGCCQFGFCQSGNIGTACGNSGGMCAACPPGQSCQFQKCTTTMMSALIGDPCTADSDCSTIAANAICKHFTSTGNAVYENGYCTLRCNNGGVCPGGSTCESVPQRGENDSVCLRNCTSVGGCRSPGYSCYQFAAGTNECWIFPAPSLTDGGITPVPDAGPSGRAVGAPCTDNSQCQPVTNFCVPEVLSMITTGYIGGYCSDNCDATTACPSGSVCITENLGGVLTNSSCKSVCFNPGTGQGICRTGYICQTSPNGTGWCGPKCTNQAFQCPSGGTCNQMTGYCN